MQIAEIKRAIEEQEAERNKLLANEKIIEREWGREKAENALKFPNILSVLGIRRCGKSVFSWLVLKGKKFGSINFDDEALYGLKAQELNLVLKAFYELYGADLEYLILDEPQNVSGWELFANRLRRTKKVIITGSNSKLLAGELATRLTGRHIDFTLFPFSYREFLSHKGISAEDLMAREYSTDVSAVAEKALEDYMNSGGFPESYKFGREVVKSILKDIVSKDVVRRHNIKNVAAIEALAKYIVSNFSREISYNKLKNVFGIGKVGTMKNYLGYFQDAYFAFVLERFSRKLKQREIAPKKAYCIDTGMINAVSFKENRGKLMENLVCVELMRRKSYWHDEWEVFYWKDHQQKEVDFVVKEGEEIRQLIQVTYASGRDEVEKREIEALSKASEELKCKKLLVVTWDYEGKEKGTVFIPLWKWLVGEQKVKSF